MNHAFIYYNEYKSKYIVQIAKHIGWVSSRTEWQNDTDIGKCALMPCVDIEEEKFCFDSFKDAENALAEHYAKQYTIFAAPEKED